MEPEKLTCRFDRLRRQLLLLAQIVPRYSQAKIHVLNPSKLWSSSSTPRSSYRVCCDAYPGSSLDPADQYDLSILPSARILGQHALLPAAYQMRTPAGAFPLICLYHVYRLLEVAPRWSDPRPCVSDLLRHATALNSEWRLKWGTHGFQTSYLAD